MVHFLIAVYKYLIDKLISSNIPEDDRIFFITLVSHQFNFKIFPNFKNPQIKMNYPICSTCGDRHDGTPLNLLKIINDIQENLERLQKIK